LKNYSPQSHSAAEPQPNSKDNFHHEGAKDTKEDFSRKGAKGAKRKLETRNSKSEIQNNSK
jgi:hypothetical protein